MDGCVYRKPHPALIYVLAGEIPYSCARIPCTAEIISILLTREFASNALSRRRYLKSLADDERGS